VLKLAILTFATVSMTDPAAAESWVRHINQRLGSSIEVPTTFRTLPAPDDIVSLENESRVLVSADRRAEVRLTGSHGPSAFGGFDKYQAQMLDWMQRDGTTVSYKASGKGWFTLSGRNGDNIDYLKVVAGCAGTVGHEVYVRYPSAERASYDRLVSRIARSLQGKATACKS
jgi:hypothetical protein